MLMKGSIVSAGDMAVAVDDRYDGFFRLVGVIEIEGILRRLLRDEGVNHDNGFTESGLSRV
jgi:hypothetical protein